MRHGIKLAGSYRGGSGRVGTLTQADIVARALCRARPGSRSRDVEGKAPTLKGIGKWDGVSKLPIYERILLKAGRGEAVDQGCDGQVLASPGPPAPPPSPPATATILGLMHLSMAGLALSPSVAREILLPGPINGYRSEGKSCKGRPWWHNLRSLDLSHCACLDADVLARLLLCSARPHSRSEAAAKYFPRLESLSVAHGLAPGQELSSAVFSALAKGDDGSIEKAKGTALKSVDIRFISLSNANTGDEVVACILGIEASKVAPTPGSTTGQLSDAELERRWQQQRARGTIRRPQLAQVDTKRIKAQRKLSICHFSCTWDLSYTAGVLLSSRCSSLRTLRCGLYRLQNGPDCGSRSLEELCIFSCVRGSDLRRLLLGSYYLPSLTHLALSNCGSLGVSTKKFRARQSSGGSGRVGASDGATTKTAGILQRLEIRDCPGLDDDAFLELLRCRCRAGGAYLSRLVVDGADISVSNLQGAAEISVDRQVLSFKRHTDLDLFPWEQAISLQVLVERAQEITTFPREPSLRELCLSRLPQVEGDSLVALFGEKQSRNLKSRGRVKLATALHHLRLCHMPKLSFVHVKELVLLSSLHSVELDAVPVNDGILWALARSRRGVRVLRIRNPTLAGGSIFERGEQETMESGIIDESRALFKEVNRTAKAAVETTGIDWADALLSRSRDELSARRKDGAIDEKEEEEKRKSKAPLFVPTPISAPPLLVLAGAMRDPRFRMKDKRVGTSQEPEKRTRLVELTCHGVIDGGRVSSQKSLRRAIALANEARARAREGGRHGDVWTSCFPELDGTSEPLLLERARVGEKRNRAVVHKGKLKLLRQKLRRYVVQASRPAAAAATAAATVTAKI